jgi:hypothetical protein
VCQTAFFHFFSAQLFMSELLLPLGALFLLVQLNCRRSFVHSLALPAARSSICMLNRSLRLSQIAHGRLLLSSQLKKWMEGRKEREWTYSAVAAAARSMVACGPGQIVRNIYYFPVCIADHRSSVRVLACVLHVSSVYLQLPPPSTPTK